MTFKINFYFIFFIVKSPNVLKEKYNIGVAKPKLNKTRKKKSKEKEQVSS